MHSNTAPTLGATTSILPRVRLKDIQRSTSFTEAPATKATKHFSRLVPARSPGTLMFLTRSSPLVQLFYIFLIGLKPVAILFSSMLSRLISALALCSRSDCMVLRQRTRALNRSTPQLPEPVLSEENPLSTLILSSAHTLPPVKRLSMLIPSVSAMFHVKASGANISNKNSQLLVRSSV